MSRSRSSGALKPAKLHDTACKPHTAVAPQLFGLPGTGIAVRHKAGSWRPGFIDSPYQANPKRC